MERAALAARGLGRAALAAAGALAGLMAACVGPSAKAGGDGVADATYAQPSTLYGHGALGAGHEWSAMILDGTVVFPLREGLVFEDIAPHLADLDGDGDYEVIVVESSLTQGSRLAVWDGSGRIAATPFIGTRHRWLAPVGAADLDGDGRTEIAYVETPHLGKILKIVRLVGDRLVPVAEARGLTNHRYGDPFIQGGIASCDGVPTILTANEDWTRIIATSLMGGTLVSRDRAAYRGSKSFDAPLGCD
ncbi:VCBS repeat-containing protein [Frigidibacter sp. RF13]|uniref:FG-GAP repeat domain-containing protein n=1 Tax=Frigidibacter sp. RF13 TaxID=2997340 RepID=UPI00226FFDBB|nr:VCBS repeat-containing protein [Frigidibacter sp. RF13]MCY1126939.1 VCBS repeat-containing protein [Frigidibacter sp. RF13]